MVHNDPKGDRHEILVKKGSGEIERNGEKVQLANWEKVSFQSESKTMERGSEIGPPTPITPGNMMPVFINAGEKAKEVDFAWTPMANAAGYRLRISHNPYFSFLLTIYIFYLGFFYYVIEITMSGFRNPKINGQIM